MASVMRCTSHSATSTSRVASSLVAVAALKPMLRCSQSPNCVIARSRYEGLPFLPTMTTYARRLGLFSGTMAVVGGIIGGGIFRTPAVVPQRLTVPVAVGAIVLVSGINYVGVRPAAVTQNIFTILKLAALAALIGAALFTVTSAVPYRLLPPPSAPVGLWAVVVSVGAALVPILFTYGGWQQTNFIAEEIIDAERNLPRALVTGVAGVVVVYVLANVAYLRVLGPAGLAASTAPAADVMRALLGPAGGTLIAAGIAVSTFGFLNLVILVTPRVLQAMAADGVFFPRLAELHTPSAAIACSTRGVTRITRFRNPNVETAIPAAISVPPAGPSSARITSAAGAVLAARPAGPSTRRYATFASRYTTTTPATPVTRARGRLRSASMISSAMKLVCCHPPYVNRMGTRAAPTLTTTPHNPTGAEGGGRRR